jgi:hypothetical protein
MRYVLLMVVLGACGPGYSEGQVERGRLNCELQEVCGNLSLLGYDTLADCQAAAEAQDYDEEKLCPKYYPSQMRECLDAYETAIEEKDCDADLGRVCDTCGE